MLASLGYNLFSYLIVKGQIRGKDLKSLSLTCKTFNEYFNRNEKSLFRDLIGRISFSRFEPHPDPRKLYFLLCSERALFKRLSSKLLAICRACQTIEKVVENDYGGMDSKMHYPLDFYHLLYFDMPDEFAFCAYQNQNWSHASNVAIGIMQIIEEMSDRCGFGLSNHVFDAASICLDANRNFDEFTHEIYQYRNNIDGEAFTFDQFKDLVRQAHLHFRNHLWEVDFSDLPKRIILNFSKKRKAYLDNIKYFENSRLVWSEISIEAKSVLVGVEIDDIDLYFILKIHQKVLDGLLKVNDPFVLQAFNE